MSLFNKLNTFKESEPIQYLFKKYDVEQSDGEKTITAIFYAFTADLVRRSNSSMSSAMVFKQIKAQSKKVKKLGDLTEVVKNEEAFKKTLSTGDKILSLTFPGMKSPLIKLVSFYAKTPKKFNVDMSYFSATYLVEQMGDMIESNNMDLGDWALYLRNHHNHLFFEGPRDLVGMLIPMLGLQDLSKQRLSTKKEDLEESYNVSPDQPIIQKQVVEVPMQQFEEYEEEYEGNNTKKILIGIVGLILLGAVGYFGYTYKDVLLGNEKIAESETVNVEPILSDSLSNLVDSTATLNENISVITELETYLESERPKGESFKVNEFAFASEETELPGSAAEFSKDLIKIMDKYPALQIKIEANDENGNSTFGLKRAWALKKELLRAGIQNIRLDAGSGTLGENKLNIIVVNK